MSRPAASTVSASRAIALDVAAGIVIAREAGAMVSDFKGRQPRIDGGEIIAANGAVHRDLLKTFEPRCCC